MTGHTRWREIRHKLTCDSCGRRETARREGDGWRAMHGREDDDEVVTVVLCPDCAKEVDDAG